MRAAILISSIVVAACGGEPSDAPTPGHFHLAGGCPVEVSPCPLGIAVGSRVGAWVQPASEVGPPELLAGATIRSSDPGIVTVRWAGALDGTSRPLELAGIAPGIAEIEVYDAGGTLRLDRVEVAEIVRIEPTTETTLVFANQPAGARVLAYDDTGRRFNAHGALTAVVSAPFAAVARDGWGYVASEQFSVQATAPGTGTVAVSRGAISAMVTLTAVTPADVAVRFADAAIVSADDAIVPVISTLDDVVVRGSPGCTYQVVSGLADVEAIAALDITPPPPQWALFAETAYVTARAPGAVVLACLIDGIERDRIELLFDGPVDGS